MKDEHRKKYHEFEFLSIIKINKLIININLSEKKNSTSSETKFDSLRSWFKFLRKKKSDYESMMDQKMKKNK